MQRDAGTIVRQREIVCAASRRRSQRRQALAQRVFCQRRNGVQAELAHDVAPVHFDGGNADAQVGGDARRAAAFGEQPQHFAFAHAEALHRHQRATLRTGLGAVQRTGLAGTLNAAAGHSAIGGRGGNRQDGASQRLVTEAMRGECKFVQHGLVATRFEFSVAAQVVIQRLELAYARLERMVDVQQLIDAGALACVQQRPRLGGFRHAIHSPKAGKLRDGARAESPGL